MNLLQESVLSRLTLEQLQEALMCLHQDSLPQDPTLQTLNVQDWGVLHFFLMSLLQEKKQASLH